MEPNRDYTNLTLDQAWQEVGDRLTQTANERSRLSRPTLNKITFATSILATAQLTYLAISHTALHQSLTQLNKTVRTLSATYSSLSWSQRFQLLISHLSQSLRQWAAFQANQAALFFNALSKSPVKSLKGFLAHPFNLKFPPLSPTLVPCFSLPLILTIGLTSSCRSRRTLQQQGELQQIKDVFNLITPEAGPNSPNHQPIPWGQVAAQVEQLPAENKDLFKLPLTVWVNCQIQEKGAASGEKNSEKQDFKEKLSEKKSNKRKEKNNEEGVHHQKELDWESSDWKNNAWQSFWSLCAPPQSLDPKNIIQLIELLEDDYHIHLKGFYLAWLQQEAVRQKQEKDAEYEPKVVPGAIHKEERKNNNHYLQGSSLYVPLLGQDQRDIVLIEEDPPDRNRCTVAIGPLMQAHRPLLTILSIDANEIEDTVISSLEKLNCQAFIQRPGLGMLSQLSSLPPNESQEGKLSQSPPSPAKKKSNSPSDPDSSKPGSFKQGLPDPNHPIVNPIDSSTGQPEAGLDKKAPKSQHSEVTPSLLPKEETPHPSISKSKRIKKNHPESNKTYSSSSPSTNIPTPTLPASVVNNNSSSHSNSNGKDSYRGRRNSSAEFHRSSTPIKRFSGSKTKKREEEDHSDLSSLANSQQPQKNQPASPHSARPKQYVSKFRLHNPPPKAPNE